MKPTPPVDCKHIHNETGHISVHINGSTKIEQVMSNAGIPACYPPAA